MKGKVYLVPFGTQGTTEFLFKKAIENITGKDFSQIVYIGPTIQKIRDAQVGFKNLIGLNAYIPPRCYTIKQYVLEVFSQYHPPVRVLPDFLKPLLIAQLARKIFSTHNQEQAPSVGYGKIIANFIRELKQYAPDKTSKDLKKLINENIAKKYISGFDEREERLSGALEIYEVYSQTLNKRDWIDTEDIFRFAIELIQKHVKINTLILDGFFYDLTALEEQVVTALIKNAQRVYALSFYDSRNPDAYALPQEFLVFLRNLNLLQEEKLPDLPPIHTDLPYYVCPSIEDEVEFIATQIKNWALKNDLDLNKTIVTFSRLDQYENLVKRVFQKYGIPYTIISGKNLSSTQPVIILLELLNAVINDYPRLSVVSCISSPYFRRFSRNLKETINYLSKKTEIIKGFDYWKNLSASYQNMLKQTGQRISKEKILELRALNKELGIFLRLTSKLRNFTKKKGALKELVRNFKALITQFQWCVGYENDETIMEIRALVYDLLERLERFEAEFGPYEITLQEFQKILKYYFDQTELMPQLARRGVLVVSFMDTRGLDCDYLFFGGLSEEKFPGPAHFDPIVPEWFKEVLNLPSLKKHLVRTRFHFFRLINTARVRTVLSYHNMEEDKLLLPSPFLGDNAIQMPLTNAIFSYEDYQRYLGEQEYYKTGKNPLLDTFLKSPDFHNDPEALNIIKNHFKKVNTKKLYFQVTELEKYARCNYRFYLENLLKLELLREPDYRPEATFWGTVVHEIFNRLYKNNVPPIENLEKELIKALEATLNENKVTRLRADVVRKIITDYSKLFLDQENRLRAEGYLPYKTECKLKLNFDSDIIISGKIDRIDLNHNTRQAYIFDYKTGKVDNLSANNIKKGITLQLPLYALLVKSRLKLDVIRAGIYSLPECNVKWLNNDGQTLNFFIDVACESVRENIRKIIGGYFNQVSQQDVCYYCQHSSLCPISLTKRETEEDIKDKNNA
ncbi:MAG: PD-(D/E)XK nuclease family protein [candidate division WOR-3 bacterium]|nr:PD-(D/E)XK nuclease family protein [candidate division WOR-3 bacterium]MDW7987968.1 PD-(D/E)XK nuclease family protein [candidate division WOR-3 bacterium]